MKVTIDIPPEFEQDFNNNRFKNSLERVEADCSEMDDTALTWNYDLEVLKMLIKAFGNAEMRLFLCDPNKRSKCNNSPGCFMNGGECRLTQYKEYAMIDENGNAIMNEGE